MHYLCGLIVKDTDDYNLEEKKDCVRRTAESFMDDQYTLGKIDYYIEEDAGRWSTVYPGKAVYAATENKFFEIVENLIGFQKENTKIFYENKGDIDKSYESYLAGEDHFVFGSWSLYCLTQLLYGHFIPDSAIYDTYNRTGRISKKMIEEYKNNPNDYFIVMLDIHA